MSKPKKREITPGRAVRSGVEHNPNDPLDFGRQWFYGVLERYRTPEGKTIQVLERHGHRVAWDFLDQHLPVLLANAVVGGLDLPALAPIADSHQSHLLIEPEPPCSPIPMLLWCPACHSRHADEGEFAKRPHKVHECQSCGLQWKPANVPTVGVWKLSSP